MRNLLVILTSVLVSFVAQNAQASKSCQDFTNGQPVVVKDDGKSFRLCSVVATSHMTSGQGLDLALKENSTEARRLCKERGARSVSSQKVHSVDIPSVHAIRVIETFSCEE